jgi:hypothetical protein
MKTLTTCPSLNEKFMTATPSVISGKAIAMDPELEMLRTSKCHSLHDQIGSKAQNGRIQNDIAFIFQIFVWCT